MNFCRSIAFATGLLVCSPGLVATAQTDAPSELDKLEQRRRDLAAELEIRRAHTKDDSPAIEKLETQLKSLEQQLREREPTIRMFSLRYVDAFVAMRVLQELFNVEGDTRIAVDARTNRLIVHAPPDVNEVIAAILEQLDDAPVAEVTRSFRLRNADVARDAVNRLGALGFNKTQITGGTDGTQVHISADSAQKLDAAEKILSQMGELSRPVPRTIRIAWLASNMPEPKTVPKDMKPVVAELEKLGVVGMSVAAQTSIRTLGMFETSCFTRTGHRLSVQGVYEQQAINISLRVKADEQEVISVRTSIDAPLGHPVVLGMSPTSDGTSAFVVTVE